MAKNKKIKAKGSLIGAKKETSSRTTLKLNSRAKDVLKSLFELPVQNNWLDDDTIDKIERDSTVTAAIGRRKSATLKKEIVVTCKDETLKEEIEKIFHYDLLDAILDTPYHGFSVYEINWVEKDFLWYPKLLERAYTDFQLINGELMFSANGMPQSIPAYKAIHATYKAKPKKPYGKPIFNTLFWLIQFKNASLEFWMDLLERFGTPWVIAKTDEDKNALADEIYNMLGGDGAVLNLEDSLEIKTADKSGNFKEIIEYLDNQIREVITGGNLTGQVTGGSQAAATVHNEIREDISRADENILRSIIKTTVRYFKEVNSYTEDLSVDLKDQDDPDKEWADRDKVIYDMGYQPTQEYIEKRYNITVEKVSNAQAAIPNKRMSFSANMPQDQLELETNKIDTLNPLTFQEQIINIVASSSSYQEAIEKILELYPTINTNDLEAMLFNNIANAAILGHAEIEDENPNG